MITKKDWQVFNFRENHSSRIPSDLQGDIIRECQHIRDRCSHLSVSTRHEIWGQYSQQLEQYREQVIALVGPRQADEILLTLYFGGKGSKQKRSFLLSCLSLLNKISRNFWTAHIDTLKGMGGTALVRSVQKRRWSKKARRKTIARKNRGKRISLSLPLMRSGRILRA
jgi:hypothetical protein